MPPEPLVNRNVHICTASLTGRILEPRLAVTSDEQLQGRATVVRTLLGLILTIPWVANAEIQSSAPSADVNLAASDKKPYPSQQQVEIVRRAFRAFDAKQLDEAESLFTQSLQTWEDLKRPRDELAELYKVRGNVRVDLKRFGEAKEDYDRVLSLMTDGENADGTAAYQEYADTFVQRGLCFEGLGDWSSAIADYSKAISLWGGGRGRGINPYVLTFRANALGKLGRYGEAVDDYRAAESLFLDRQEDERAVDCGANAALAVYAMGDTAPAVQLMRDIIRRRPGYADMHIALAAHAWSVGEAGEAEAEWEFACNQISVGCRRYRDSNWVSTVRRWPPVLASRLAAFLNRTLPAPLSP